MLPAEAGAPQSRPCGGARARRGRAGTFPLKRREGGAPGPKDPSKSWEGSSDASALRDASARGPGGSTAGGAGEVTGTPRGPGSARPPAGGAPQGQPAGDPGCGSSPLAGQFRDPAQGFERWPRRPGGEKRGPALTCSWHRAARGRLGTVPRRPGPAGPAPSARTRGAGATLCARGGIRSAAGRGERASVRAAGRGRSKQEARALRGAPTALRGRPLRLLATTSPFPARGPALLLGPSMTHRSPRVPPSISLPSPKRDAPSTTTPCLQSPGRSAGGLG